MSWWRTSVAVASTQAEHQLCRLAAPGTSRATGISLAGQERNRVTELDRSSRVQLDSHPIGFGGGMAKAVIADRAQSGGQDMAQVAARELNPGQSEFSASIVVGAVFPAEGHRALDRPGACGHW